MVAAWTLALCTLGSGIAHADSHEHFTALEENDSLYFNSDKHYTQGLRLSYLGPDVAAESAWNRPFDWLAGLAPIFRANAPQRSRRYALFAGQSIFTPKETRVPDPDPRDRPYAGWLYLGTSLLQESGGNSLENLEIALGVVGPAALGEEVQNTRTIITGSSA